MNIRFVKSFSNGQITIPKEFRDIFGITKEFWLKLYIQNGKIIVEPVENEQKDSHYLQRLKEIEGDWFSTSEYEATRGDVEKSFSNLHNE